MGITEAKNKKFNVSIFFSIYPVLLVNKRMCPSCFGNASSPYRFSV